MKKRGLIFVYFLHAQKCNRIKIGSSGNPNRRMNELLTSCPDDLILLGMMPEQIATESEVKALFRAFRVQGEWFEADQFIFDYIGKHCTEKMEIPNETRGETRRKIADNRKRSRETLENLLQQLEQLETQFFNIPTVFEKEHPLPPHPYADKWHGRRRKWKKNHLTPEEEEICKLHELAYGEVRKIQKPVEQQIDAKWSEIEDHCCRHGLYRGLGWSRNNGSSYTKRLKERLVKRFGTYVLEFIQSRKPFSTEAVAA